MVAHLPPVQPMTLQEVAEAFAEILETISMECKIMAADPGLIDEELKVSLSTMNKELGDVVREHLARGGRW
jgi:hypothetical protein